MEPTLLGQQAQTCVLTSKNSPRFGLEPSKSVPHPGKPLYTCPTVFQIQKEARDRASIPPHAPFASFAKWQLTEILVKSGIFQGYIDKLLKSDMVSRTDFPLAVQRLTVS